MNIDKEYTNKLLSANIICLEQSDIDHIISNAHEVTQAPLKGKQAKAALLYVEVGNQHTLEDINAIAQRLTEHCAQHANILWAAHKTNTTKVLHEAWYAYGTE